MLTTNSDQKLIPIKYDNITLNGEPLVFLSDTVWDKIKFLCTNIKHVEWSGCIFYKFLSDMPNLSDASTLMMEVVDIIPLDKGTAGFTEYNFDSRVLSYMTEMDYFELKIGHCHSHHEMKTFFSGTDMSELNDNSEFIKPYLSLIVNNAGEFTCKLAFRVDATPVTYSYKNLNDSWSSMVIIEENVVKVAAYNCAVVAPKPPLNVSEKFLQQFEQINKPKVQTVKKAEQLSMFDEQGFQWKDNHGYTPLFEEQDGEVTGRELELMSCCILRLGQKVENDSIELVLEDIENSINQRQINFDKYCKQLNTNIKKYIFAYWETEITDEELEMFTGDFIDELIWLQNEFPFVDSIILEFDKTIL